MTPATTVTRETATVWRAAGRRYLTRRSAFMALARARMMRDHEDGYESGGYDAAGTFTPPERCHCSWCSDVGQHVWRRYTRVLMRHATEAPRGGGAVGAALGTPEEVRDFRGAVRTAALWTRVHARNVDEEGGPESEASVRCYVHSAQTLDVLAERLDAITPTVETTP